MEVMSLQSFSLTKIKNKVLKQMKKKRLKLTVGVNKTSCFPHLCFTRLFRYRQPLPPAWLPVRPSEPTCLLPTATHWWWSWLRSSPCSTSASSWWRCLSRYRRRWGQHHGERPSPGSRQTPLLWVDHITQTFFSNWNLLKGFRNHWKVFFFSLAIFSPWLVEHTGTFSPLTPSSLTDGWCPLKPVNYPHLINVSYQHHSWYLKILT